ncbi:hypothetical protein VaNZ11_004842 [Volvox africanus]|uniref:DUF3730 domain-containing protein n=1 Tax=Volvox africanus TaxID=51714 RepID=A0ABQ5RXU6_9CHLO|nr:hypothetical protein VaNZ11_004842 [Volvox africanus]
MGLLKQYFENGDMSSCAAHIEALWAGRHQNKLFGSSDAEDAAWLLDRTQRSPTVQRQLWPKLLGLLTRWAFLAGRADVSEPAGSTERNLSFLIALQRRLAACLTSGSLPWAVRAPILLLIAVVGCSTASNVAAPLQLACQALHAEMLILARRPSADIFEMDSPDTMTDVCTAAELVLERLMMKGDWRGAISLFAVFLSSLGSALSDLCIHIAAEAVARSLPSPPPLPPPPLLPCVRDGTANDLPIVSAAAAAAAQEAAAAALAALQASCRMVGSSCARALATAATALNPGTLVVHATASSIGATATDVRNPFGTVGHDASRPEAAAVLAAIKAIAEHVHGIAAATASAAAAAAGVECGVSLPIRVPGRPVQNRRFGQDSIPEAAMAGGLTGVNGESRAEVAPAAPLPFSTDPWVPLAVAATAASGLLEGFIITVRLQPLGQPQELLLRLLQPGADRLVLTLKVVSGATAAAASRMASDGRVWGLPVSPSTGRRAVAMLGGRCSSACALHADSRITLLSMAVGYSWVRLRTHAPLPGPYQPAAHAAEQMAAAAMAASQTAAEDLYGSCWHPARGALTLLMVGSLGVGRVVKMACAGAHADAAVELLESHSRGPLYSDGQLLAKSVIGSLRASAPGSVAVLTTATPLAMALLSDAATAAERLHLLYSGVADTAAGRAWLAALPSAATGRLRELLDRVFVCAVSVLAAVHASLSPAPAALLPLPKLGAAHLSGDPLAATTTNKTAQGGNVEGQVVQLAAEARAVIAVTALGALADLQFCALQLRAHGDLVTSLSTDAAAAPVAAVSPLLALLPCYPSFAAAYAGNAGHSGGGFAAKPVAASRLAFLLPLAASCVPHAEDVEIAACVVLPYIYLLFKGAPESVVQAAHSTWAALLAGLSKEKATVQVPSAGGGGAKASGTQGQRGSQSPRRHLGGATEGVGGKERDAPLEERRDVGMAVAASMVPYYIDRTCEEPCNMGDLELLEWGLRQVLRSLPEAHPVKIWVAARLARQLRDWSGECEETDRGAQGTPSSEDYGREGQHRGGKQGTRTSQDEPEHVPRPNRHELVQRCAVMVGAVVAAVDYNLLPHTLSVLTSELQVLRPEQNAVIIQCLHDVWLTCNDYSRKQCLDDWLMHFIVKARLKAKL